MRLTELTLRFRSSGLRIKNIINTYNTFYAHSYFLERSDSTPKTENKC